MGSGVSGYKLLYNKKAIEGYLRRRYGVLNQNDNVIKMIDSALLNCPFDINIDSFRMDRISPYPVVPVQDMDSNSVPGGISGKKHKHNKDYIMRNGGLNGCGVSGEINISHQHSGCSEGTYSLNFVFRSECASSIRICANRQDKKGEYICIANWKDYPPGTHTYSTIIQDMVIPLETKPCPTQKGNNKDEIAMDQQRGEEERHRIRHRHRGKKEKKKKYILGDPSKKQAVLAVTGCILCVNVKLIGCQYRCFRESVMDKVKGKGKTKSGGHKTKESSEENSKICLTRNVEQQHQIDPVTCVDSCTYFFSLTLDKTKFEATNDIVIPHLAMRKVSHRGCTYLCESVFAASTDMMGGASESEKKEQALCCICMSESANTLFLPCRHLAMCEGCTKEYVNRGSMCCPICREQATSIVEFRR